MPATNRKLFCDSSDRFLFRHSRGYSLTRFLDSICSCCGTCRLQIKNLFVIRAAASCFGTVEATRDSFLDSICSCCGTCQLQVENSFMIRAALSCCRSRTAPGQWRRTCGQRRHGCTHPVHSTWRPRRGKYAGCGHCYTLHGGRVAEAADRGQGDDVRGGLGCRRREGAWLGFFDERPFDTRPFDRLRANGLGEAPSRASGRG